MSDKFKAKRISDAETGVPLSSAKEAEEIYANSIAVEKPPQQGGDVGEALNHLDGLATSIEYEGIMDDINEKSVETIRAHLTERQQHTKRIEELEEAMRKCVDYHKTVGSRFIGMASMEQALSTNEDKG